VSCRFDEFLGLRDIGNWVRFDEIRSPVFRQAEVDPAIAVELKRPADSLRVADEARAQLR
jgi:hypothetical protein